MKQNKAKQIILGISIALVSVFFVVYAIQSFYPAPMYEDFCDPIEKPYRIINSSENCIEQNGTWHQQDTDYGFCDLYSECSKNFESVREVYEKNVFYLNLLFGVLVIIISLILTVDVVSNGVMGAGAILLIYGTMRYWSDLENFLKTLTLGFVLAFLVYIGYKKLK